MIFTFKSTAVEATEALGRGIAHVLRPGDVIALHGELGAGKTALVRGIAAGLGIAPGLVSSPTFVVVNQYPVPAGGAVGMLVHVDAYRVRSTEELENVGWDRLFDREGRALGAGAAVIEWPERVVEALPRELASVTLSHEGEDRRTLVVSLPDSWSSRPDVDLLTQRRATVCPVSGKWVAPTSATYPFADARARDADLYKWIVPVAEEDE